MNKRKGNKTKGIRSYQQSLDLSPSHALLPMPSARCMSQVKLDDEEENNQNEKKKKKRKIV